MKVREKDMLIFLILVLAVFQVTMTDYLVNNPDFYQLDAYTWESEAFREVNLGEYVSSMEGDFSAENTGNAVGEQEWRDSSTGRFNLDDLTVWMIEQEYDLRNVSAGTLGNSPFSQLVQTRRLADYRKLKKAYEIIFKDLRYFPIPESLNLNTPPVTFENGWMDVRTYGGERRHEGCDIMGNQCPRGFYPVVSISDGTVERVGWLEQGGWRIGIRTPSGLYIYYAHLYGYSSSWKEGDQVKAGELLGFMGDSGYSSIPGTVGNFDVHLHIGMYMRTDHYEEMSINPYWILRYLKKYRSAARY